jgi:uncharacterized protein (DUF1330 family)
MPAYLIADIAVRDQAKFDAYRQAVPAVIAAHGGRYLVRGGTVHPVEGEVRLNRLVVLEFASLEALRGFYASADYAPLLKLRLEATDSRVVFVEGWAPPA